VSVLVAVTNSKEGLAALRGGSRTADVLAVPLTLVNLTGSELDTSDVVPGVAYDVVNPDPTLDLDEVEQVLLALEARPDVNVLVVGVRKRSPLGKAVLGSLPQRLILEAPVPVLAVKAGNV
jgi:hypothetical protein